MGKSVTSRTVIKAISLSVLFLLSLNSPAKFNLTQEINISEVNVYDGWTQGIQDGSILVPSTIAVGGDYDGSDGEFVCIIHDSSKEIYCWGENSRGQLGQHWLGGYSTRPNTYSILPQADSISAGHKHACALKSGQTIDGASDIFCWGDNSRGQFGNLEITADWTWVEDGFDWNQYSALALSSGGDSSCTILVNNANEKSLWCWGGLEWESSNLISPPDYQGGCPVGQIWDHDVSTGVGVCATLPAGSFDLDGDGWMVHQPTGNFGYTTSAYGPGDCDDTSPEVYPGAVEISNNNRDDNCNGIVDQGNNLPIQVQLPGLEQPTQVSVGSEHACVITTYSNLYCWGSNGFNQLTGNNPETIPLQSFLAVDFSNLVINGDVPKPNLVAAGSHHTCATMSDNNVSCWGRWNGNLGNTNVDYTLPVRVETTDPNWIPTGDWNNVYSQTHSLVPISISAGSSHTCITAHNTVFSDYMNSQSFQTQSIRPVGLCWGEGGQGQLGQGNDFTDYQEYRPIEQKPRLYSDGKIGNSVALIAGGDTTCSVKSTSDLAIRCFGSNDHGTYGHDKHWSDSYYSSANPVAESRNALSQAGTHGGISLKNYNNVRDFDVVDNTGCFIVPDYSSQSHLPNRLFCWGMLIHSPQSVPIHGQYNQQSTSQDRLPIEIIMPSGLSPQKVKVSENWACAIMDDRSVWCWGQEMIIPQLNSEQTGREQCSFHSLPSSSGFSVTNGAEYCQGTFRSGDGNTATDLHQIPLTEGATSIILGLTSGCVSTISGKITCWGTNYQWGTKQSSWQDTGRWEGGYPSSAPTSGIGGNSNFATQLWDLLDGQTPSTSVDQTSSSNYDDIFSSGGTGTLLDILGMNMCVKTVAGEYRCYGSQVSVLNTFFDENKINTWLDTDDPAILDGSTLFGSPITSIARNLNFICSTSAGDIYCAGKNDFGQLGNGIVSSNSLGNDWTQVTTPPTLSFDSLAINSANSICAWDSSNPTSENIFCWGSNFAELPVGLGCGAVYPVTTPWINCYTSGNRDIVHIPTQAFLLEGAGSISKLQLNQYGGCALFSGNLECWGYASNGNSGCEYGDYLPGQKLVVPGCTTELQVHLPGTFNHAPSISSISLVSTESPDTLVVPSSTLICSMSGVSDLEGSTLNYHYEYVLTTTSGVTYTIPQLGQISVIDFGIAISQIHGYSISPGDLITCIGTVTDSNSNSVSIASDPLAVSGLLYPDMDADGFGESTANPIIGSYCIDDTECQNNHVCVDEICAPSWSFSINNLDCDDSDPTINPNAFEDPYNGVDDDCDGQQPQLYLDWDNDGFGDPNYPLITTCAVNADCSGNDVCHAMLGHSTCIDTSHPIFTETCTDSYDCDVEKYLKVASGNLFSCALKTTYYVVCWGAYSTDPNPHPGVTFTDIEAGAYGMCGITQATNSVLCWNLYGGYFSPSNQYERLQVPNVQFQSIKLDFEEVCGLTTSGELYCELLAGTGSPSLETQSSVIEFDMANSLYNLGHRCHIYDNVGASNIDNIDCIIGGETYHSAAITPPSGLQFSSIATGFGWSCGLVVGGAAECWGNSNVQNNYILQNIPGDQFLSISAGMNTICGVNENFVVKCWGQTYQEAALMTPPAGTTAKSVSVGRLHVCSITLDDDLYCWGNDGYSGGPYSYDGLLSIPAGQTASCINSVCSVPNYVTISSPSDADCNDQDATVFPTNNEIPNNAIDDNCNGQIDETSSSNSISLDTANLAITLAAAAGAIVAIIAHSRRRLY